MGEEKKGFSVTTKMLFGFAVLILSFVVFQVYDLKQAERMESLAREANLGPLRLAHDVQAAKAQAILLRAEFFQSRRMEPEQAEKADRLFGEMGAGRCCARGRELSEEARALYRQWRAALDDALARPLAPEALEEEERLADVLQEKLDALDRFSHVRARELLSQVSGTMETTRYEKNFSTLAWSLLAVFIALWISARTATHIRELREARSRLSRSEEHFRSTFEQAAVGMAHASVEGKFLRVNRRFAQIMGYAPEELKGMDFREITYPEDLEMELAYGKKMAEGEIDTYSLEKRHIRKSGEPVWTLLTVSVVRSGEGEALYMIGVVEDINAKVITRQALIRSREKFRMILDSLDDILFVLNGEGRFLEFFAPENEELIMSPEQFLGKHHREALPPDLSGRLEQAMEEIAKDARPRQLEYSVPKSGGLRWYNAKISPRRDGRGGYDGVLALVRDITPQKEAEEKVRSSEELYRSLVENLRVGIVLLNREMEILSVNRSARTWFHFPGAERRPVCYRTFMEGQAHPCEPCVVGKTFEDGEVHEMLRMMYTTKGARSFRVVAMPVRDEEGRVVAAIEMLEDVTDRLQAEEEMKRKDELLMVQSRQAAMGEMISMIAHQWRQPLTTIGMGANNMMFDIETDRMAPEAFRGHLAMIDQQVHYLSKTIDDFRNFFRPEKKREIATGNRVVEESLDMVGKSLENNGIAIVTELEADSRASIYKNELVQVMINLLKNAKDVLHERRVEEGEIRIRAFEKEGEVVIEVCDNGGGIDREHLERIFEPYFTTKDEKTGTGLGLYMCKTIMDQHLKGGIAVENRTVSEKGKAGACFLLRYPLDQKWDESED